MVNLIKPACSPADYLTCHYQNRTSHLQIIRLFEQALLPFERVLFPGQQLIFEARLEAVLEVHTGEAVTAILADRIPCKKLQCRASQIGQGASQDRRIE